MPITLSESAALSTVGVVIGASVMWAAFVSVRSATVGPSWAMGHLARARLVGVVGLAVAAAAAVIVAPVWVGLGVGYVALVVLILASAIRRNLVRLTGAGGFEEIPDERRQQIVARARIGLGVAAIAVLAVALVAMATAAGPVAWTGVVVGSSLLAAAALIGRA